MIEIRAARVEDLDWLLGELKTFDEFYGTKKKLFGNEEYIRGKLTDVINHHVLIVAEENGQRMGFIAGIQQPHFYNPEILVLQELFWWVDPKFRRTRAASLLLDEFISFGRDHADWICFGLASMTPIKPKNLLRRGFTTSDQAFILET